MRRSLLLLRRRRVASVGVVILKLLFVGEYLEKIIPLVVKFCNVDDDELREYCIQAFESFVRRYHRHQYCTGPAETVF